MTNIKLVVFDMAGTIIDHGCFAPIVAFVEAFSQMGITLTEPQARGPMGLHKRDHIRELFKLPEVAQQWQAEHKRAWKEDDVDYIYKAFVPLQKDVAGRYTELIPGVTECVATLREAGIAIATSTGYPREVTTPVLASLREQGLEPDCTICADEVRAGRPAPWMIFRSMEATGVFPASAVVKVGDTIPDIVAARNASVFAVGVTETSNNMGLTSEQLQTLDPAERTSRRQTVEEKLQLAGAHVVIDSVASLPDVLERL